MKTPFKSVPFLLLPLFLSGCFHKAEQVQTQPLAPPVVDNPPPAPQPSPTELPPPVVSVPSSQPAANNSPPPKPEEKPVKRVAHHPKPETKPSDQASNAVPAVSAVGQLSSGDPADLRQATEDSITSTEHGLKDINRSLNDQEQKTVAQIREFLKQAHTALTAGDIDGAHTLALKAKVLLGEIAP